MADSVDPDFAQQLDEFSESKENKKIAQDVNDLLESKIKENLLNMMDKLTPDDKTKLTKLDELFETMKEKFKTKAGKEILEQAEAKGGKSAKTILKIITTVLLLGGTIGSLIYFAVTYAAENTGCFKYEDGTRTKLICLKNDTKTPTYTTNNSEKCACSILDSTGKCKPSNQGTPTCPDTISKHCTDDKGSKELPYCTSQSIATGVYYTWEEMTPWQALAHLPTELGKLAQEAGEGILGFLKPVLKWIGVGIAVLIGLAILFVAIRLIISKIFHK